MLSCLDDIQRIREYNWAATVQEVWFLEHTRVRQPINRMAYPRLFRWGTFAGKTSPFPIASLTGQQVIKNLTVERNEMETIYKGNQTVPEDTSMVPPAVASLSSTRNCSINKVSRTEI
ncbi:hypothetical protein Taro_011514 [Colocasia esculenta]|uniref:Uncharacterized protein n=1 Tax=Colocasia esculenta TaxID=4460 RepID=A0A843U6F3_COLES|nr:hypothetical protein [Colocasia esculenta]